MTKRIQLIKINTSQLEMSFLHVAYFILRTVKNEEVPQSAHLKRDEIQLNNFFGGHKILSVPLYSSHIDMILA